MRGNKTLNYEGGRPMLLYSLSELNGIQDKIVDVDADELHEWEEECLFKEEYPCDHDIFEVCCILMEENNWQVPSNGYEAAQLYMKLKNQMKLDLNLM